VPIAVAATAWKIGPPKREDDREKEVPDRKLIV
jgi:hypothetical protein